MHANHPSPAELKTSPRSAAFGGTRGGRVGSWGCGDQLLGGYRAWRLLDWGIEGLEGLGVESWVGEMEWAEK